MYTILTPLPWGGNKSKTLEEGRGREEKGKEWKREGSESVRKGEKWGRGIVVRLGGKGDD